jgi:hypothetical protein
MHFKDLTLTEAYGPDSAILTAVSRAVVDDLYPAGNCPPAPTVMPVPYAMGPYNRHSGYYFPAGNVVTLQGIGTTNAHRLGAAARGVVVENRLEAVLTVIHELAHWYQHAVMGYESRSTVNVHRHATWGLACEVLTALAARSTGVEPPSRDMFRPTKSMRHAETRKVAKISRDGALSDVELRHFPRMGPVAAIVTPYAQQLVAWGWAGEPLWTPPDPSADNGTHEGDDHDH